MLFISPQKACRSKIYFHRKTRIQTGLVQQTVQIVARFAITI